MNDITIKEKKYRTGRLDARRQFHVVRRLAPVISSLTDLAKDLPGLLADPDKRQDGQDMPTDDLLAALGPLADAIASMSDTDADYVINSCLAVVERQQPSGGWAKIMVGDALQFEDLDMAAMLRLTFAVLEDNLGGFFGELPPNLTAQVRTRG